MANGIQIDGVVKSIRRFDSGYGVAQVDIRKNAKHSFRGSTTMVGDIAFLSEGMSISAHVVEKTHPTYGLQLQAIEVHESGFASIDGLVNYLASKTFKGIGKTYARAVITHFQEKVQDKDDAQQILALIDSNPSEILSIAALPLNVATDLSSIWAEKRTDDKLIAEIMSYGLSNKLAIKVHKHYGENSLDIMLDNFYSLTDVPSIGFVTADEIALRNGVPRNSDKRVRAAVIYVIEESQLNGHCYLEMAVVGQHVSKLVGDGCSLVKIGDCIRELAKTGDLVIEENRVYLTSTWYAEKFVAEKLYRLMSTKHDHFIKSREEFDKLIDDASQRCGFDFAEKQKDALYLMMTSNVCILTGGPGTGKTTITKTAIDFFELFNASYDLCSPTGMAAERLAQATTRPAQTIHRLLEWSGQHKCFMRSTDNPLESDIVLMDEASMVDLSLFRSLVSALSDDTKLIIIGDADQLPSVGAGNILRDLIASGTIPTVKLDVIFRQAKGSEITIAAHDVLHGRMPELVSPRESKGKNCMFVSAENMDTLKEHVEYLVTKTLPSAALGYSWEDIQILTPMRKRGVGVDDLNPLLQGSLNPPAPHLAEIVDGFRVFRVGDRVMQTRNDYDKNVFNGFIGKIASIVKKPDSTSIFVKFQSRSEYVEYIDDERDDLQLAYAQTIHKAQGGEYPVVILIIHPSQHVMLKRNLLYTGLTRARKHCILIGTAGAIEVAVNCNEELKRNTTLKQLLQKIFAKMLVSK